MSIKMEVEKLPFYYLKYATCFEFSIILKKKNDIVLLFSQFAVIFRVNHILELSHITFGYIYVFHIIAVECVFVNTFY